MEELLNDEKAIKLAESARQLLEHTFDDVLIRDTVVKELKDLSFVWKRFPQVLKNTIDEAKNTLANPHELSMMELGKMTDVLKLAKHSPKLSYKIIQFVLQLVEEPDGWCHKEECIRRLCYIAEQMPQHAGEVLPTLAKGCVDEDATVRMKAMVAVGRVVASAPQHAGEVLPTLAKGCVDEDATVRMKAMVAVGRVVASAPQHAGEVLPTLAKGCVDENATVRMKAMVAVGRVVASAPQHTSEVLPRLAKGCVNENASVRWNAMVAVGCVVASAPQHAGEVLPTLAMGCVDENASVRWNAMVAVGRVVASAPQHAGEVLPTLAKGCVDENATVRWNAMEAVGRVVAAAPQHAGEVLPTLAKGCVDENATVRRKAMEAVGRIELGETISSTISLLPSYKGGLLFFFVQNSFTFDSRTELETVPFVLHTSSPQEIGSWVKEVLDLYVTRLSKEFNERFPGLLAYLTKE